MPTLTINKTYQDGQVLTEAQLDAALDSIADFVNVTGLGADNIQDNSIGSAELQTSSVTETKLAANTVSTPKIQDSSVTLAKLAAAVQGLLVPIGSISAYSGDTAPTGWMLCDGSTVSRVTYAGLYALVGNRFGVGDGTTTFHLPDFRGRFLRGTDAGSSRDPDVATRTAMNTGGAVGALTGSVQGHLLGQHSHSANTSNQYLGAGAGGLQADSGTGAFPAAVGFTSGVFVADAGGGETRPINAYVNFIIKVG